ncbi:MAG: MFS transporter [Prevotellaceae bacterium]|nr:MFS transporter [Prevotellaceae bacterium]
MGNNQTKCSPWAWLPTLYFAEGLPYVVVTSVACFMYKLLGLSNADATFYTAWLMLPWVIKPFWSPFVDLLKTKRWWVVSMQLIISVVFGAVAFLIPTTFFLQATLAMFWIMAFGSATHDIAADGFYMLGLDESQQSFFVGIRNTFYRFSTIAGEGLLVMLMGYFFKQTNNIKLAWSISFFIAAIVFFLLFVYHRFILPRPDSDKKTENITAKNILKEFLLTFVSFFEKRNIIIALLFILFYRFSEAMLVTIAPLFIVDSVEVGGLGLNVIQVGGYKTIGIIGLLLGGIVGGIAASRRGLKFWLLPMALSITLPHLVYVYFAYYQPDNYYLICSLGALEQFGYGFGFTAYMLYLIYFAKGEHKTAHYAICTGFMALSMFFPKLIVGKLQEYLGYEHFFIFIMICSITTWVIIPFLKIDGNFGRKAES